MLSIIIPIYNVEQYLEDCVNSILFQCSDKDEIILVDDGSPDACPQICDRLANEYSNIKTIHQKNGGLSAARNTGIRNASGDYLVFLDSDDKVLPDAVKTINCAIKKYSNPDIIAFPFISQRTDKDVCMGRMKYSGIREHGGIEYMLSHCNGAEIWPAWKHIVKREFILENNLFFPEGRLHEDVFWSSLIWSTGSKNYYYFDKPWYLYNNSREGAITSKIKYRNFKDMINNAEEMIPLVKNSSLSQTNVGLLLQRISEACFSTLRAYFNCNHNERNDMKELLKKNINVFEYGCGMKYRLFIQTLKINPTMAMIMYSGLVSIGEKKRLVK